MSDHYPIYYCFYKNLNSYDQVYPDTWPLSKIQWKKRTTLLNKNLKYKVTHTLESINGSFINTTVKFCKIGTKCNNRKKTKFFE